MASVVWGSMAIDKRRSTKTHTHATEYVAHARHEECFGVQYLL